jgi:hypothetical protein
MLAIAKRRLPETGRQADLRRGDAQRLELLDYLEAEGFEIERLERPKWGIVERLVAPKAGRRS